jgi:hypothetical protein
MEDGHVSAYRKAYLAEARKFAEEPAPVELDQCIRAGLAAIQWPSREVHASPEMREVPLAEIRQGDTVCRTGVVEVISPSDGPLIRWNGSPYLEGMPGCAGPGRDPDGLTLSRPVSPLPDKAGAVTVGRVKDGDPVRDDVRIVDVPDRSPFDVELWDVRPGDRFQVSFLVADVDEGAIIDIPKDWKNFGTDMLEVPFSAAFRIVRPPIPKDPGSRGNASVRGVRCNVVRAAGTADKPWMSAELINGESWHADSDLSDYVPLLDGEEA